MFFRWLVTSNSVNVFRWFSTKSSKQHFHMLLAIIARSMSWYRICNYLIAILIRFLRSCFISYLHVIFSWIIQKKQRKTRKCFSVFALWRKSGCRYCKYWNLAKVKLPFFIPFLFHFWFVFKRNWPRRD